MVRIVLGNGDYMSGRRAGYDAGFSDAAEAMVPAAIAAVCVTAIVATVITAAACNNSSSGLTADAIIPEGNLGV